MKEKYRTKRKTKDIDEIHEDLKPQKRQKLLNQELDLDKPGQAQHYCITCAYVFSYLVIFIILIHILDFDNFLFLNPLSLSIQLLADHGSNEIACERQIF